MEIKNEDRLEPEVEIGHEPGDYVSASGFQRPRPPQPASFKKWVIGLIIVALIGFGFLGTWLARTSGILSNKPAAESPDQKALKMELAGLKTENDSLKKDLQSLKEGQKNTSDQIGKLQEEVKTLRTLLEKKATPSVAKKPASQVVVYKVKKGDTLKSVAQKFNVSPEEIRRWNHLEPKSQPKPGQRLTIHSSSET